MVGPRSDSRHADAMQGTGHTTALTTATGIHTTALTTATGIHTTALTTATGIHTTALPTATGAAARRAVTTLFLDSVY